MMSPRCIPNATRPIATLVTAVTVPTAADVVGSWYEAQCLKLPHDAVSTRSLLYGRLAESVTGMETYVLAST